MLCQLLLKHDPWVGGLIDKNMCACVAKANPSTHIITHHILWHVYIAGGVHRCAVEGLGLQERLYSHIFVQLCVGCVWCVCVLTSDLSQSQPMNNISSDASLLLITWLVRSSLPLRASSIC